MFKKLCEEYKVARRFWAKMFGVSVSTYHKWSHDQSSAPLKYLLIASALTKIEPDNKEKIRIAASIDKNFIRGLVDVVVAIETLTIKSYELELLGYKITKEEKKL
jgi:hypothetical protein